MIILVAKLLFNRSLFVCPSLNNNGFTAICYYLTYYHTQLYLLNILQLESYSILSLLRYLIIRRSLIFFIKTRLNHLSFHFREALLRIQTFLLPLLHQMLREASTGVLKYKIERGGIFILPMKLKKTRDILFIFISSFNKKKDIYRKQLD